MKIRTDFVTNSSSSSYIIARKGGLNEKQKEAVLEYIERTFLSADKGETLKTIEDLNQYVQDDGWIYDGKMASYYNDKYDMAKNAIENGLTVFCGRIIHEGPYDDVSYVFSNLWKIVEYHEDGNFMIIDDDLSY